MTDVPFRVYGPQPLNGGVGETMYTAPSGTSKFFLRDISLTLVGSSTVRVKMNLGDITVPGKRVVDNDVTTANSPLFIRPLWLMDAGETLQGFQSLSAAGSTPTLTQAATGTTAIDGTSVSTGAWTPAATTMYLLVAKSGVASGTTALNPSSITGNGTWTAITGGSTTSTVPTAINGGIATYWFYSSSAGSSATTTVNFASTQHNMGVWIFSVANVYAGTVAISPWTSTTVPYAQAASAADSSAPASDSLSKVVTLGALQTGIVTYHHMRMSGLVSSTPPGNYTEISDAQMPDASGSLAPAITAEAYRNPTPETSTSIGPATYNAGSTAARVAVAIEWVPAGFVNCMVSGIEVH
jgi:hypothetical protein